MLSNPQIDKLTNIRKEIHAHPEVAENEFQTQRRIIEFLKANTDAHISEIAGTGVLATFGSTKQGKVTMVRGDIDALPIQEVNTFEHKSETQGVSHKCGHDGHTAILLGLAMKLTESPIAKGQVLLVFQPAEENGAGAKGVMADEQFQQINIDYAFALHNLPGFQKHQIVVKENEFTCHVKSIIIKLYGKTSHAAEPEKGHNPASMIADLLHYAEKNSLNQPESANFFLITPIYVNMGDTAYGISAGYGEVHLTIRCWSTDLMRDQCYKLESYIEKKCQAHYLTPEVAWLQEFYANLNHPEAVSLIKKSAEINQFEILQAGTPFKWGEDFGLFTQQFKGAMFGLGAGKTTPALHNPDYDFPDDITPTGVAMFYQIINQTQ